MWCRLVWYCVLSFRTSGGCNLLVRWQQVIAKRRHSLHSRRPQFVVILVLRGKPVCCVSFDCVFSAVQFTQRLVRGWWWTIHLSVCWKRGHDLFYRNLATSENYESRHLDCWPSNRQSKRGHLQEDRQVSWLWWQPVGVRAWMHALSKGKKRYVIRTVMELVNVTRRSGRERHKECLLHQRAENAVFF
jgi:hypothetical protein